MLGGLWRQGRPDGSSMRNMFESSFTKERTRSGNDIFEDGFNFSASEAKNKFNSTESALHR